MRRLSKKNPLYDFRNFMFKAWKANRLPEPTRLQYWLGHQMQHGPDDLVVLCFRGFAKSTIGSTRGNHCLYVDNDRRFLNISAAKGKADENSQYMLHLMKSMEETRDMYPRRDQRASVMQFDINGATQALAPSVKSLGITSNALNGSRASDILADDVESAENSKTDVMRQRIRKKVKELNYILRKKDDFPADEPPKLCYLGTPQLEDSLYWELEHTGHHVVIIPARYPTEDEDSIYGDRLAPILREDLERDESLRGKPTEPTRFGEETLLREQLKAGETGWALQYMLSPSLAEANRYPLKLSDLIVYDCDVDEGPEKLFWSHENLITDIPYPGLQGQDWHGPKGEFEGKMVPYQNNVMAIDPSAGGTDELAYAVIKTINSQVFLLDCGGFQRGDAEETMAQLARISKRWKITNIRVEKNFGMGIWSKLFLPFLQKYNPNCYIDDVHVVGMKNTRICDSLDSVVNTHRLIVNRAAIENDQRSSGIYHGQEVERHQLFYQMSHITRKDLKCLEFDDRLDALSLAVSAVVEDLDRNFEHEIAEREIDDMQSMLEDWNANSLFLEERRTANPSFLDW